jgi:hypothetical protein
MAGKRLIDGIMGLTSYRPIADVARRNMSVALRTTEPTRRGTVPRVRISCLRNRRKRRQPSAHNQRMGRGSIPSCAQPATQQAQARLGCTRQASRSTSYCWTSPRVGRKYRIRPSLCSPSGPDGDGQAGSAGPERQRRTSSALGEVSLTPRRRAGWRRAKPRPWTGSWTGSADNPSVMSAIRAIFRAIGAARVCMAREHASRNA